VLRTCERIVSTVILAVCMLSLPSPGAAADPDLAPAPPDLDARAIAVRAEDNLRSDRTRTDMRMVVTSPRLPRPRTIEVRSWEDRPGKRSLIRIDAPAKDSGTGFLKLHPNLWMYIPRVERTVRIPPSMMLQSWMGSDFTNDDLVRESSAIDDYDHRVLGIDHRIEGHEGSSAYVIEYLPHEDAAVVWGRIISWIEVEHASPLRQEFYDEDGTQVRTLRFEDFRDVGERRVPHRWSLTPLDKPGHRTVIELDQIEFDSEFDDSIFTTRNLRRSD
jgi:outer membrane lipoprotein-sorting protein